MVASIAQFFSHLPCWTSDAVLLERFIHERDEAAFVALIARYGALVLRLCRRILGDAHAAEDAFQATFLILARKAHSLKQPDALPAWLYGVARRVALKARTKSARRPIESLDEALTDPRPDPLTQVNARELLDILDAEVQRLPAAQRSAFVLCCLEGHTQEEAARILRCTPGSIKGRLERGRQRLQTRLQRRGIALSAALALMVVMRDRVEARVPELLLQSTIRATLHGGISSTASALAHSVLRTMLLGKLSGVLAVTLALAMAASTTAVLTYRGPAKEDPEDKKPPASAVPEKAGAGKLRARTDALGDPLPDGAIARLGTIRYRVGGGLNHAALSPDGNILATTSHSGIALIDLATGKPRYLRDSTTPSYFDTAGSLLAFAPDGKQVVNVTRGGNLRFWDVTTGQRLRVVGDRPEPSPSGPAFPVMGPPPPAGTHLSKVWFPLLSKKVIAGTPDNCAVFVDPSTGTILHRFQAAGELTSVGADGKSLTAIDAKHPEVILYDERGKELRRFRHEGKIDLATLCQGGKRLVTVNGMAEIKVWDVASGREQRTIAGPAAKNAARTPTAVSITRDGSALLAGTQGGDILRWDLGSGKEREPLRGHTGWMMGMFYSPDGRSLISLGFDNVIRRWKLPSGQAEPIGEGYAASLRVARSNDGRTVAATSHPGRLEFWDSTGDKRLGVFSLPASSCSELRFAPDGRLLALGCSDGKLRLWDVAKGRVSGEWRPSRPGANEIGSFMGLAWSPDGRFLAASLQGVGLQMWEASSGKEIWQSAHESAIAFSADGKTLVSQDQDHGLAFHDAATGKVRFVWMDRKKSLGLIDITYSRDGSCLATSHGGWNGGFIYLRDPETGEVRKTLQSDGLALSISFSPDSKWLVSGDQDRTIRLWEVSTGTEVFHRQGHDGWIVQVEFGSDGRTVLSASDDLTALLWDLHPSSERGRNRSLEMLWGDLAGEPAQAYRAVWELADNPKAACEFLRKKIAPVKKEVDERRLQALLADLDNDEFAIRQRATEELEKTGEQALPVFRKALEGKPSLESRRRLEDLLAKVQRSQEEPSGERLRLLRAIEVLELAGTKEAREVLEVLAARAEGAQLTEQAKAALERLRWRRGK